MSLTSTKEQLIRLLNDEDNKVIALSGKWGTGKSFMWRSVKASSQDANIQNALYVSLFGVSKIEQIKIKLMQGTEGKTKWFGASVTLLEKLHTGFGALNDIAILSAPTVLGRKIIVLDDIERKHESLSIDEVLGFIDEFTQQHSSRFVLILNSDRLQKRDVWETLREKVVDQELCLSASPTEAFEVAIGLSPSPYSAALHAAVRTCELTNIRIIRKVIKVVNRILGGRQDLTGAVLSRVIPSTVLLSIIHYRGIEDGPDFNFVLSHGTGHGWTGYFGGQKEPETEESKRKSKWKLLMTSLGIKACDDFELLVIEFLESGLFDSSNIAGIIDRYVSEVDVMSARDACNNFLERSTWEHTLTNEQLLELAAEVAAKADLMGPYMVTSLHETIMELPNGQRVADEALSRWIDAFRAKNLEEADLDNVFQRKVHPLIEAEFKAIAVRAQANTSGFDACLYIVKNGGWGVRQEEALKSATADDLEIAIRMSHSEEMRLFMLKMLEWCIHQSTYKSHFGSAMDNFILACRKISHDPSSGRLGELIKRLFADSGLADRLERIPEEALAGQFIASEGIEP